MIVFVISCVMCMYLFIYCLWFIVLLPRTNASSLVAYGGRQQRKGYTSSLDGLDYDESTTSELFFIYFLT
jgi:hypothetical protein